MGRKKNDGGRDPNLSGRDPNLSGPEMIGFTFFMVVFYGGTFLMIIVLAFVQPKEWNQERYNIEYYDGCGESFIFSSLPN